LGGVRWETRTRYLLFSPGGAANCFEAPQQTGKSSVERRFHTLFFAFSQKKISPVMSVPGKTRASVFTSSVLSKKK